MPISKTNNKQNEQITQLQTDVSWIKNEILDIKNNHIQGIYKKLDNQKNWLVGILGALVLSLISTLFNLLK